MAQRMSTTSSIIFMTVVMIDNIAAKDIGPCRFIGKHAVGGHCFSPSAHWEYDGTCIETLTTGKRCFVPDTREFKFTLRVSIRQLRLGSDRSRPLERVWIRGTGPGLSWSRATELKRSAGGIGIWITDIKYRYDSRGILCNNNTHCSFNQRCLEFRVYLDEGGKHDMIGPNIVINFPVSHSMYGHHHFLSPRVDVHPWFGGKTVSIEEFTLSNIPFPLNELKMNLLYPPSFEYNIRKMYPVLILFGTKEGRQIVHLLESMYVYEATIQEVFIINIHYKDSAPFCAFNPYTAGEIGGGVNLLWKCKNIDNCHECITCWDIEKPSKCYKDEFISSAQRCLHPVKCGGIGEALLDIIEKDLITQIESKIPKRLLLDFPKNRLSVIGFDGAGLLACHAAISRPYLFQNAACLSAPFYWPISSLNLSTLMADNTGMGKLIKNISHYFMFFPERKAFYSSQKYYIDYGEMDNYHFPVVNSSYYVDWFISKLKVILTVPDENILHFQNVPMASNIHYLHPKGGTEVFNRIRLPLLFFLGAEGGPNVALPALSKRYSPIQSLKMTGTNIPEECVAELQILEYKASTTNDVPMEILIMSIGKHSC